MIARIIISGLRSRKYRVMQIVLCLGASVALLFSIFAIVSSIEASYRISDTVYFGDSDITIDSNNKNKEYYFDTSVSETLSDQSQIFDTPWTVAVIKNNSNKYANYHLYGMSINAVNQLNLFDSIAIGENKNPEEFTGNYIIVSKSFAEESSVTQGDSIVLKIAEKEHMFLIFGISQGKSILTDSATNNICVVPAATLRNIMGIEPNFTNRLLLRVDDKDKISSVLEKSRVLFQEQITSQTFSEEKFLEKHIGVLVSLGLVCVVTVIMCLMIAYNLFKADLIRRMSDFGRMRCLGATKRFIYALVLCESLFYGVAGGLIGCLIGCIITVVTGYLLRPDTLSIGVISVNPVFVLVSIGFSLLTAALFTQIVARKEIGNSSLIKIANKGIAFVPYRCNPVLIVVGVILLIGSIVFVVCTPSTVPPFAILVIIVAVFVSSFLLFPFIISSTSNILGKILNAFEVFPIARLSINSLAKNRSSVSGCSTIAVCIAAALMINSALSSVLAQNVDMLQEYYNCDYVASVVKPDEKTETSLLRNEHINSVYGSLSINGVDVIANNNRVTIYTVDGADSKYFDFHNYQVSPELISNINTGRNILLSSSLRDKLSLEQGDAINLVIDGNERKYQVLGFFDTSLNNGSYAIVSRDALIEDTGAVFFTEYLIKATSSSDEAKVSLEQSLIFYDAKVTTTQEVIDEYLSEFSTVFLAIRVVSWLPFIVSIIILISSSIISYHDRRRTMAIFRAVGATKRAMQEMFASEQIYSGVIGALLGVVSGIVLIRILSTFFDNIHNSLSMQPSLSISLIAFLVPVAAYALPFIISVFRINKLVITAELKTE
jgi:putative ABC transport system permease protein